jgi:hypothetical protein
MEDKQFDQIMKSKLDQVSTPYQPASWHQLAEKLDARAFDPTAQTTPIDELAKRHLATPREMPFVAAHWEQLAGQMDRVRTLVVRLRTAKIAEAAIIILTLLNLDAFSPKSQWQNPAQQKAAEPIVQLDAPARTQEAASLSTQTGAIVGSETTNQTFGTTSAHLQAQKSGANSFFAASTQQLSQAISQSQEMAQLFENQQINQAVSSQNIAQSNSSSTQNANLQATDASLVQTIPTLQPGLLTEEARSFAFAAPLIAPSANAAQVHFSVYAGPDIVRVSGENDIRTTGYTSGLQVSKRKGKWGVASGVEYTKLRYQTTPVKEVLAGNLNQGFVGRTLRSLDFELVQVPVRVTRKLYKKKGTEILATAGVQAMATVQISPDYNAFYTPGSSPDPTQIPPVSRLPFVPSSKGLFEGGSASENIHAVAQAGLRLEQRMGTSNKLLFVEVNGQSLLTRRNLGPADDSFAGIGLRTGVMAAL